MSHVTCTAERLAFLLGVSPGFVRDHLQGFRVDGGNRPYHLYNVLNAFVATLRRTDGWWGLFARLDRQSRGAPPRATRVTMDHSTLNAVLPHARRLFATTWNHLDAMQRRNILRQLTSFLHLVHDGTQTMGEE